MGSVSLTRHDINPRPPSGPTHLHLPAGAFGITLIVIGVNEYIYNSAFVTVDPISIDDDGYLCL